MSPSTQSAKLKIIYGLKMGKTADLDTFFPFKLFTFTCMYNVYVWWLLSMGADSFRGGGGGASAK